MHLGSNDKVAMFDYTRMLDKRMIDEGIIAFTGPQWTSHIQLHLSGLQFQGWFHSHHSLSRLTSERIKYVPRPAGSFVSALNSSLAKALLPS